MRFYLHLVFVLVLALMAGCSAPAPTATSFPTPDVSATVAAAVEATRAVDRSAQATSEARAEATRSAAPTSTPVVMTIYAPTPEPYVAAPGSIEQGVDELHTCLLESEEFRALFLAEMEMEGMDRESADYLASAMVDDKELFTQAMLGAAEMDPEYASMLSLLGGMVGELCGPGVQAHSSNELGMSNTEAETLLAEYFDCYHSVPAVKAMVGASLADETEAQLHEFLMSDRNLFIAVSLAGARQDPDAAESLTGVQLMLDAMCR